MHLIVGLGNPGSKYQGNRHNIGFMAVDEIVRRHGFSPWRKRFQGETSEGLLNGEKVLLLDLEPGKVRVKLGGGAAGHNGIRSMIAHCGPHFVRVRMGIGHPGHKALVHGYVLSDFAKADAPWLGPLLDAVADHSPLLVKGEEGSFQNKVHLALNPAPEKPAKKAEN